MQKISEFMFNALFDAKVGYYKTKNPIGKGADFITAPEISQVFGELLAAYLLQVASAKQSQIAFVEMGAGKGTLCEDILGSIQKLADKGVPQAVDFLKRASFHIIEINPVLQGVQKKNLADFSMNWHENFAEFLKVVPEREIFFISNELFDCFPIDQFIQTERGWCERMTDGKKFILNDFNAEIHEFIDQEVGSIAPIGAFFEYSLAAQDFMKELCIAIYKQGGIAINIDYGYSKNEFANSLQAVKDHQKCNVLETPGEVDITALVDFGALEKVIKEADLESSLITQREFLIGLGIEKRREILLQNKTESEKREINLAIDRLIAIDQMGDLFKCLIVWK